MRILVIGAYGLIGGYVAARLLGDGHEVVGVGRDIAAAERRFPAVRWVQADLRRMTPAGWAPRLDGVGAVVNCAGVLQDGPRDSLEAVHLTAVSSLVQACHAAGVSRFVQISAAGVQGEKGRFQTTKFAADQALQRSDLEWIILRPGLVLAPAAYGGSALLRGLAAFPGVIPALNAEAPVQVVSVEDVAEAAARSVRPATSPRFVCDLVSAEKTRLRDILVALRGWLGLPPARLAAVPPWCGAIGAVLADGLAWLGWRSPMRTTSLAQLNNGVTGEPGAGLNPLGVSLKSLDEILAGWPSGVQERWFARLYFMKPAALVVLTGFWAVSGLVGFTSHAAAARLLTGAKLPQDLAEAVVLAGSAFDVILAALVCVRRTTILALQLMLLVTTVYLVAASFWLPSLWQDPLGPLVKSIPAAFLALVALAMMDER